MQTDRYDYAPIIRRKPFTWPNNARVALMVAPNIEFFHIDKVIPGAPGSQLPDVTGYALRDYGSRIGVFRMRDVLDKHGIRATVLLNADVCAHLIGDVSRSGTLMVKVVCGANDGNLSASCRKRWRSSTWNLPRHPAGDTSPLRERIMAAGRGGAAA